LLRERPRLGRGLGNMTHLFHDPLHLRGAGTDAPVRVRRGAEQVDRAEAGIRAVGPAGVGCVPRTIWCGCRTLPAKVKSPPIFPSAAPSSAGNPVGAWRRVSFSFTDFFWTSKRNRFASRARPAVLAPATLDT
jgi:hypothetical protein